jgi:hypothetical protein
MRDWIMSLASSSAGVDAELLLKIDATSAAVEESIDLDTAGSQDVTAMFQGRGGK